MNRGTAPPGVVGDRQIAHWVRAMFDRVAHRYDLLNHLLSFNVDRYWRARTIGLLRHVLQRPDAAVLDICCGSGDLALALDKGGEARVFASDFSHPMLRVASRKFRRRRASAALFEADALQLPFRDASFDLVTVAFGFRNLVDYRQGLAEMRRVLKPGGLAAILEFSQPPNPLLRALYGFYSRRILPLVGGLISGSREAYAYLPDSVSRFPGPDQLAGEMLLAGFHHAEYHRLTGGIAVLHLGAAGE